MSFARTLGQRLLALFIALHIARLFEVVAAQADAEPSLPIATCAIACPDWDPCSVVRCPADTRPTVIPPVGCGCATCKCVPITTLPTPTTTSNRFTTISPTPTSTCGPVFCPMTVCSGPCPTPLVPTSSPVPCGCPKCGCGLPPKPTTTTVKPTYTPCPYPIYCPATVCTCQNGLIPIETYPYCKCPVCDCVKPTGV